MNDDELRRFVASEKASQNNWEEAFGVLDGAIEVPLSDPIIAAFYDKWIHRYWGIAGVIGSLNGYVIHDGVWSLTFGNGFNYVLVATVLGIPLHLAKLVDADRYPLKPDRFEKFRRPVRGLAFLYGSIVLCGLPILQNHFRILWDY